MKLHFLALIGTMLIMTSALFSQKDDMYQKPPKSILDLVDAPLTPYVSVNSAGDWMLLIERPGYPSIEELAQPELRLAGLRINPRTNAGSRSNRYTGLKLKNISNGKDYEIKGLPDKLQVENIGWSPDGQKIAITQTRADGLELWVIDVKSFSARQLTKPIINDAMRGLPFRWMPDNTTLLALTVPSGRGEAPVESLAPAGPVIQETTGKSAPVRTYQDLLQNPHDEELFDYYATSQLLSINSTSGDSKMIGRPGIITTLSPSPDGNYILLGTIDRPYSYLVPYYRFPVTYNMIRPDGKLVTQIAQIPLAENIPKGFGAVRKGPRSFTWRSDKAATLYWVEAQDEGDPANEVEFRDQLFSQAAPFDGQKKPEIAFNLRYGGVTWGNDELAIGYEYWWSTREEITSRFQPGDANSREILFKRSSEDRYNDPGNFVTTTNKYGEYVLLTDKAGKKLYLTGQGASPEGERPFIREFDLTSKETEELWRSQAPYYEYPIRILDIESQQVITRRESKEEPANYLLRNLKSGRERPLTTFENPYPALKGVDKQVVHYQRKDGVDLQGDLYLPQGYDPETDDPLPVLMWAYPREYKSAASASQVSGSPYEFIRLYWGSPIYWVTRGYAIFDGPSMPVIGEEDEEPNDSFREQLVANAEAAIDKLVEMGVGDRERIGVGGHSYGAFMTANLLAHSDLFAAGIARSGAYNRTLTPFGFQAEERTYWEAPEVYYTMSPFMHADKLNEPILLIHGEADNNSGTYPLQSKRYYNAIKGLGGTARLVMLPHESHGYRARESILHTLWEMDQWLETYVKKEAVKP